MILKSKKRLKRQVVRKVTPCPICKKELEKDLLAFFNHLRLDHFPVFEYKNGHFLSYDQDGKLLDFKVRNVVEKFAVGLLTYQSGEYLKRKKGVVIYNIDKCSICKISRSFFTKYTIDKKYEFLLCKKCKDKVLKTANRIHIIYNPTEQGKR